MRVRLVVNPKSGRGPRAVRAAREALIEAGLEIAEGDEAIDCIVVAGGDGTLIGQVGRAISLGVPLGIIPTGTFNDLARTLGIPFGISQACATIAAGHARAIDVARVNGVYYVNEASIGLTSRIARLQTPEIKQRFGFLAIVATALRALRHSRPLRAEISYDGRTETFKTIQLTIANSHRFGGLFMASDAAIACR